jgi:DNA-binding helix-hairpin-helix protein with protein kinase domain
MAKSREQPVTNSGSEFVSEDERRLAEQFRTVRERQKQALNLQRINILSQATSQPARRAALEAALTQIEGQIQAMG